MGGVPGGAGGVPAGGAAVPAVCLSRMA